ncbi:MAG: 23S rRNA (uracil(1939)-C(5))-methyltransferase RlmD [Terracidiphilus sp.]|jgi:23S rRNA (uracil1939-C5)-methyltransferase
MKRQKAKPAQSARGPHHNTDRDDAGLPLVEVIKPIYGGAFLSRVEGKAVFVPLTLPGEQARIRIIDDKRGYATAEAEQIVTIAPERIAPACSHFGICGGCQYQHVDYETQLSFKKAILRETLTRTGVPPPEQIHVLSATLPSQAWAYRNRIRLAFDSAGNPGYRGRRSHSLVPVKECPIAAPLLVEAAQAFAEVARKFTSALRPSELSLFCNADETALLAGIYTRNHFKVRFDDFANAVCERIPEFKGAELVAEGRAGEQPRTVAQWGAVSLSYRAAGFDYRVDHGAFFQVNRWLIDALVEQVTASHSGSIAWDLFAGVGLFARQLTSTFAHVVAVESAPSAINALEENLHGAAATAAPSTALDFLRRSRKDDRPNLIVVDPPRMGLGAEITAQLISIAAPALVYVSCDPATLARDLLALIAGGYQIQSITLADLFPQTFHLETVVHLRR